MNKHFDFTVDPVFARQHNEYQRDSRRLQTGAAVLGTVLIVAAIAAPLIVGIDSMSIMFGIILAIFGLISWIMVPVIPRKVGDAQSLYDRYDLIPAVVAKVGSHDLELLALVNTNTDPDGPAHLALSARTIASVPGTPKSVGARVPSVGVTILRTLKDRKNFDEVNPMPIGWATKDPAVLARAEKAIPEKEWKLLAKNIDRLAEVQATRFNLLPLD